MKFLVSFLLGISAITSLDAISVKESEFYNRLYDTDSLSYSDIDLIIHFSSASEEWNRQTTEIIRGYMQIVSGKITPEQFIQIYGKSVDTLSIITQKMRMSALAMKNSKLSSWHLELFDINQEMASHYIEFKIALQRSDFTSADYAFRQLKFSGEKKAKYLASLQTA